MPPRDIDVIPPRWIPLAHLDQVVQRLGQSDRRTHKVKKQYEDYVNGLSSYFQSQGIYKGRNPP